MICELCKDPWEPFFADKYIEHANSFELHALLCKCPQCGALYDVYPEGRAAPEQITEAEARERFPGALLWTGPSCMSCWMKKPFRLTPIALRADFTKTACVSTMYTGNGSFTTWNAASADKYARSLRKMRPVATFLSF